MLAILSNVDRASLAGTLKLLDVPFDPIVSAGDVGSYKPGIAHFATALSSLADAGMGKDEVLHVVQSKHHDIAPASALGLTTIWVNRRHGKKGSGATLTADAEPHLTVTSLAELTAIHKDQCASAGRRRVSTSPSVSDYLEGQGCDYGPPPHLAFTKMWVFARRRARCL